MNAVRYVSESAVTAVAALFVSATVTILYSFIVHGTGMIDWETSIRLAITLGIIIPWVHRRGLQASSPGATS